MTAPNFDILNLDELKERYHELLTTTLKVEPDPVPSFLEISGFPHYEEVISNWYGFFFDSKAQHGFQTLFIDTLVEMINESGRGVGVPLFDKCCVIRERTVKDKRIDLLLYDETFDAQGEEGYRNAIIIENKIFASLYNELGTYYSNITTEGTKAGVVLSISRQTSLPETFINITHTDFLNRVLKNLGGYLYRASDKYLILLKDVIQQISVFNKTENMKAYVSFYFENAGKINEINRIRVKAIEALIAELQAHLEPAAFRTGRKYPESVNMRCSHHNNILLMMKTDQIFDQASYTIELWVTYDLAKALTEKAEMINRVRAGAVPPKDFVFNLKRQGSKYAWLGTQTKTLNRTLQDIQQLPSGIAGDLRDNWSPFILQILQILGSEQGRLAL